MRIVSVFFASILCVTCQASAQSATQANEVIYHVFQRSFYDSNGDGHGDLNGLHEKLDYLKELGVTSILLLPLYHSEFYHNYFATDFEAIDPEFGTMGDYHSLVRAVHVRGMKLYLDMETQYITEDHLWYKDSYGNPASEYTDYLIYNGPGNTKPESILWDMTELNGYNGIVRKITTVNLLQKKVLDYNIRLFKYWMDPDGDGSFEDGVDGFRLDHMMDDLDWKGKFVGLFEKFWSPLIDTLKSINPNLNFISEQANWESFGTENLERGNADRVFAFRLRNAIASFDKETIMHVADTTLRMVPDQRQVIVMLENHDLDRFASLTNIDPGKLKVAAAFNLLLGGTPSIYYGQEIGMRGAGGFGKYGSTDANDIPRREAFEWYRTVTGEGMALWYKDTGPWWEQSNLKNHDGISLEEQRDDQQSLWNTYQKLITLRKWYPALVSGSYHTLTNDNQSVYAFLRESDKQRLVVLINLSGESQTVQINPGGILERPQNVWVRYGDGSFVINSGKLDIILPGYGVTLLEISM